MSLLVHFTKEYDGREVYLNVAFRTSSMSLFVLELDGDVMSLFVDFTRRRGTEQTTETHERNQQREKQTMRELVTSILASVPLASFAE